MLMQVPPAVGVPRTSSEVSLLRTKYVLYLRKYAARFLPWGDGICQCSGIFVTRSATFPPIASWDVILLGDGSR